MTVVEIPPGAHTAAHTAGRWLGGRFRLDERISTGDHVSGSVRLLVGGARPFLVEGHRPAARPSRHDLPAAPGRPVPRTVADAVQSAAKVSDPRLATIYDTDFDPRCPYIVAEWTPDAPGRPGAVRPLPASTAAAGPGRRDDRRRGRRGRGRAPGRAAAPAAPRARCAGPTAAASRSPAWVWTRPCAGDTAEDPVAADTTALARMLYALLAGYWPGDEPTALPPAPRRKGQVCTPRQVRPECPPSWTPSPTAPCKDRQRTPRCGRRPRPGWPWRCAWCSARRTGWSGRSPETRYPARGPAAAGAARPGPGWLRAPDHAAAARGLSRQPATPAPGPGCRPGHRSGSSRRPGPP